MSNRQGDFSLRCFRRQRAVLALLFVIFFLIRSTEVFGKSDTQSKSVPPLHSDIVTLERAIALAAQYNYQLSVSREEIPRTEKLIAAAKTEGLPQFRALALPSQEVASPGQGNLAVFGLAAQPITQLYRVKIGVNIEHLERNMAQQTVRLRLQQAVNAVRLNYYTILEREDAIKSVAEQIKYLTELTHVVEGLVVKGAALDVDLLEVRTRLAAAQLEEQNLADSLSTNNEELNHLMGRDPRIPFSVVAIASTEKEEVDMSSAETLALKQRPELQQQQILVQKILAQRKLILSHYIPDVSVAFTALETKNLDITFPRNYFAVGFLANYDVYDWNRKVDLAQADSIAVHQERLHLSDLIDQILIDVRDKCRQLRLARQRLSVATMQRDAARERLRVDTKRLQVGATMLSRVLESEAAMANANRQYTDSILALWSAKSEFERAIGKDFI